MWRCDETAVVELAGQTSVTGLAYLDSGALCVADAGGALSFVSPQGKVRGETSPHKDGSACVAVAARGDAVVSVAEDASIAVTDQSTLKQSCFIRDADSSALTSVQWRTAAEIVVATESGRLVLFDARAAKKQTELQDLTAPNVGLNCLAVHPNQNTKIATGCVDGSAKVWDLRNMTTPEVQVFNLHSSDVWDICFPTQDANTLLTCSQDGTVAHFKYNYNNMQDAFSSKSGTKVLSRDHVARFSGKGMAINSVDCSYSESLFVGVGDAGQIVLTNL
ncbi:Nucleoporin Nup43 [Podochytrium sp. JEL0797]|nr:Nucleoporin Nup43 [Podochytrium sp. JEL0797]